MSCNAIFKRWLPLSQLIKVIKAKSLITKLLFKDFSLWSGLFPFRPTAFASRDRLPKKK